MRILLGMGGKWNYSHRFDGNGSEDKKRTGVGMRKWNHCHRFDGNGSEDKKRTGVLMRISWEWEGSGITFTGNLERYHLPLDWVHGLLGNGRWQSQKSKEKSEGCK